MLCGIILSYKPLFVSKPSAYIGFVTIDKIHRFYYSCTRIWRCVCSARVHNPDTLRTNATFIEACLSGHGFLRLSEAVVLVQQALIIPFVLIRLIR